jgi:hypothetical protein
MAARRAQAQESILQQALVLAAMAGVDASGLGVTHKDPQQQALLRLEALATFLGELVKAQAAGADSTRRKAKGEA